MRWLVLAAIAYAICGVGLAAAAALGINLRAVIVAFALVGMMGALAGLVIVVMSEDGYAD